MKFLPLLAVGFYLVAAGKIDKEEAKEMLRNMSKECKEQEKATDADIETMLAEKYPDSKEGKCLVACMQETFGIVYEGKFSKDGFMGMAALAAENDEAKLEKIRQIADECENVADPDRCEQAIKIGKCMQGGAEKRQLTMDR